MGAVLHDSRSSPRAGIGSRTLRAFALDADLDEAIASTMWSVDAAMSGNARALALWMLDDQEALTLAARTGGHRDDGDEVNARRLAAVSMQAPTSVDVPRSLDGDQIAFFPLVRRERTLGLLEVSGSAALLERSWERLEAVAGQTSLLLATVRSGARPASRPVRDCGDMVLGILRAETSVVAVEQVLEICEVDLGAPSVAWLSEGRSGALGFVGGRGCDESVLDRVALEHAELAVWRRLASRARAALRSDIAGLMQVATVEVVDAGDAIVFVGRPAGEPASRTLDVLGVVLAHTLRHRRSEETEKDRRGRLDLAIARTGHELRGPLAGARMAIERVLWTQGGDPEQREVLRQTERELRELSLMVDGLLRWGVTAATAPRRQVNLTAVVRKAARSVAAERGEDRVRVEATGRVTVPGDAGQLRTAIANLIRNALSYSPPDTQVEVSVCADAGGGLVSVEDRGPGLPDDAAVLFEPLVRGSAGHREPGGQGLGLFIAKQVVEAHQGRIWAESRADGGAAFHLEIPSTKEAKVPCAR